MYKSFLSHLILKDETKKRLEYQIFFIKNFSFYYNIMKQHFLLLIFLLWHSLNIVTRIEDRFGSRKSEWDWERNSRNFEIRDRSDKILG